MSVSAFRTFGISIPKPAPTARTGLTVATDTPKTFWSLVWHLGIEKLVARTAALRNLAVAKKPPIPSPEGDDEEKGVDLAVGTLAEPRGEAGRGDPTIDTEAVDDAAGHGSIIDEGYHSAPASVVLGETEAVWHAAQEQCSSSDLGDEAESVYYPAESHFGSDEDEEDEEDDYDYDYDDGDDDEYDGYEYPDYGHYLTDVAEEGRKRQRAAGWRLQQCTWLLMKTPDLFASSKAPQLVLTTSEGEVLYPTSYSSSSWADLDDEEEE